MFLNSITRNAEADCDLSSGRSRAPFGLSKEQERYISPGVLKLAKYITMKVELFYTLDKVTVRISFVGFKRSGLQDGLQHYRTGSLIDYLIKKEQEG